MKLLNILIILVLTIFNLNYGAFAERSINDLILNAHAQPENERNRDVEEFKERLSEYKQSGYRILDLSGLGITSTKGLVTIVQNWGLLNLNLSDNPISNLTSDFFQVLWNANSLKIVKLLNSNLSPTDFEKLEIFRRGCRRSGFKIITDQAKILPLVIEE